MVVHRDVSGGAELVLGAEATPPPITPVSEVLPQRCPALAWCHFHHAATDVWIHQRDDSGTELRLAPKHPQPQAAAPLTYTHAPLLQPRHVYYQICHSSDRTLVLRCAS